MLGDVRLRDGAPRRGDAATREHPSTPNIPQTFRGPTSQDVYTSETVEASNKAPFSRDEASRIAQRYR